jgi:hypothetical protein
MIELISSAHLASSNGLKDWALLALLSERR